MGEGEVEGNNDVVVVVERKSLWGVVALSQRGRGRGRVTNQRRVLLLPWNYYGNIMHTASKSHVPNQKLDSIPKKENKYHAPHDFLIQRQCVTISLT